MYFHIKTTHFNLAIFFILWLWGKAVLFLYTVVPWLLDIFSWIVMLILIFFLTLATIENNLKQNKKQKQTQK